MTTSQSIMQKTGLTKTGQWLKGWWPTKSNEPSPAQQFKEWMVADKQELAGSLSKVSAGFRGWVSTASLAELAPFTEQVANFCRSLNFELIWVINPNLNIDPQLKESLAEVVTLYCLAHWHAIQAQDNIRVFAIFNNWQNNPMTKEHQALSQRLFARLVEKKLIPEPPPSLFLAPEAERQAYIIEAIRQAAAKDILAINEIIKEK